jgi:hypothetical protein
MRLLARRSFRIATCTALLFHLAAIMIANLPATTAFGTAIYTPFAWYLTPTGLWQTWDMFTTIPHFRGLDGALVAVDESGAVTRYGPLLPGFAPFVRSTRIEGSFMRLAFSAESYPAYSNRYLAAVCRALLAARRGAPTKVGFELKADELRALADIRKDGLVSQPKTFSYGPTTCVR